MLKVLIMNNIYRHHLNASKAIIIFLTTILLAGCGGSETNSSSPKLLAEVLISANAAIFNGPRGNYVMRMTSSAIDVSDTVGSEGTRSVSKTQPIRFSDVTVNPLIGANATSITKANLQSLVELYIAYFNRVPDADGLNYWIDQFKAGKTLDQIGESFYAAAIQYSALTGYSSAMSNEDFVKIIYRNVLGRVSLDQAGLDYWTSALSNREQTRGTLIRTIIASAYTYKGDATLGWVALLLENKVKVANLVAVQQGLNFNSAEQSILRTSEIASLVSATDTTAAIGKLGVVDWSFRLAPNATFLSAPIPVLKTSYLNFKTIFRGQTTQMPYTHAMAYGDFFQDGSISLMTSPVVAKASVPSDSNKIGTVKFYKNINGGWFDKTSEILADNRGCVWPRKAVSADFNGDKKPDIFLACHGFDAPPFSGEKQILFLSQPDGTYRRTELDISCYCHSATAADLNGNGFADLVITDTSGPYIRPMYLHNSKNGTFAATPGEISALTNGITFPPDVKVYPMQLYTVEFVDVNGDGAPDLYMGGHDVDYRSKAEVDGSRDAWTPRIFINRGNVFSADYITLPIDRTRYVSLDILIDGNVVSTLKADYNDAQFKVQRFDIKNNVELPALYIPNNGIFWIMKDPIKGIVTAF